MNILQQEGQAQGASVLRHRKTPAEPQIDPPDSEDAKEDMPREKNSFFGAVFSTLRKLIPVFEPKTSIDKLFPPPFLFVLL